MKKKLHCRIAAMSESLLVAAVAFQLTGCGRISAGAAEPTPPEVEVVAVDHAGNRYEPDQSEPRRFV